MSFVLWASFAATAFVIIVVPGPSQMMVISNSMSSGFKRSLVTVSGNLSANIIQITVASTGLIGILNTSRYLFEMIKWGGVLYLLYLGFKQLRKKSETGILTPPPKAKRTLYLQGFMTSASNPKAVVFFGVLFPQFIDSALPVLPQFLILGLTYLVIQGSILSLCGRFAAWVAFTFKEQAGRYLNKVSGTFMIGAAIILGLKGTAA